MENGKDVEDGELENKDTAQDNLEQVLQKGVKELQRPRVPSPPPAAAEEALQGADNDNENENKNKKKLRKKMEKAHLAGHKIDEDIFQSIYGPGAKAKIMLTQPLKPIRANDVQALVLWILADRTEGKNPIWAFVQNVPLIKQIVLLFVPGISASLFSTRQDLMPSLASMGPAVPMAAKDGLTKPAYNIAILLNVPLSKEKQQYINQTAAELGKTSKSAKDKEAPFPPSHYVLKPDMMEKMGYPLPETAEDGTQKLPEGFVSTTSRGSSREEAADQSSDPSSSQSDVILALDCEMCETLPGLYELTRISLLDNKHSVIYDQLVKPSNPITNYHTDKSGITEALLKDVATTLPDVQARFLELVPAEAILVGHALENDLKALKVVHMRCIDTGALYPHPKGLPFRPALRRLADRILKKQIQQGQHDSVIDATTALDLALLKIRHGPAFGLSAQRDSGEPLPEVLTRANKGCTLVDRNDTLQRFLTGSADGISCTSDKEVGEKLCKEVKKGVPSGKTAKFIWAQLRGVSDFYEGQVGAERQQAAADLARAEIQAEASAADKPEAEPRTSEPVENAAQPVAPQESNGVTHHENSNGTAPSSKRPRENAPNLEAGPPSKKQHVAGAEDVASAPTEELSPSKPIGREDIKLEQRFALLQNMTSDEEMEEGEQEDTPEEAVIRETDAAVGRVLKALPSDTVLVVCTCQGNTARTRYLQEKKMKRAQGIIKPPWTHKDELEFQKKFLDVSSQGVCFVAMK